MVTTDNVSQAHTRNRRDLFLIIGTLVLVVAASIGLYAASQQGLINLPALLGTKNKGVLVSPPLPIADLPLRDHAGEPFDFAAQPKRWTLLVPVAGGCATDCEQALYLTRQVDLALGRESNRVRRYVVVADQQVEPQLQQLLREQHADVTVLHASGEDFARFFDRVSGDDVEPPRFHVVDPYGWLMMYYSVRHDGHAVLDDLKFLVKNAHENEVVE